MNSLNIYHSLFTGKSNITYEQFPILKEKCVCVQTFPIGFHAYRRNQTKKKKPNTKLNNTEVYSLYENQDTIGDCT